MQGVDETVIPGLRSSIEVCWSDSVVYKAKFVGHHSCPVYRVSGSTSILPLICMPVMFRWKLETALCTLLQKRMCTPLWRSFQESYETN